MTLAKCDTSVYRHATFMVIGRIAGPFNKGGYGVVIENWSRTHGRT